MLPNQDHPLTLAYMAGARAATYEAIMHTMTLVAGLEKDAPEILKAQCKLAAEVLLERSGELCLW